jgi:hypothetical protein
VPLTGRAPCALDPLRSEIPIATVHTTIDRSKVRTGVGLSILHRPTHTIVRLGGDIDIGTAPALRDRLPDRVLRPWRDRA